MGQGKDGNAMLYTFIAVYIRRLIMSAVSLFMMLRLINGVRCYQPDPSILHSLLALHLIVLAAIDHHC